MVEQATIVPDVNPADALLRASPRRYTITILVLLALSPLAFVSAALIFTYSWQGVLITNLLLLGMAALPLWATLVLVWIQQQRLGPRMAVLLETLRRALAAEDDALVPPDAWQPEPLNEEALGQSLGKYKYVTWLDNPAVARLAVVAQAVAILLTYPYLAIALPLLTIPCHAHDEACFQASTQRMSVSVGVNFLLMAIFAVAVVFQSRASTVTVNSDGLLLRRVPFRAEKRIAWSQVRSLVCVRYFAEAFYKTQTTYLLDAGEALLTWGHNPDTHVSDKPQRVEQLTRVVVARTGVTLRDATPLARAARRQWGSDLKPNWLKNLDKRGSLPSSVPGLAEALAAASTSPRHRTVLTWLALVPLAAYIVFCVVGWIAWRG